ncbi:MAG: type II CRISPR-associated endonuclease Cas1, partial [Chthoniobacterales bacterium]
MIKHTLEIAERPAKVSLRKQQLVLSLSDTERQFACEDIGVLILQHPGISISAAALDALLQSGVVVVICGDNHLPSGLLLPTLTHTELVPRMMAQLSAKQPARKRLWQFIIQAKILAQADQVDDIPARKLRRFAQQVRPGDPENFEAQAAKIYWPTRFPEQYGRKDKRDPQSNSLFNSALNYGYAILRACTARALISA